MISVSIKTNKYTSKGIIFKWKTNTKFMMAPREKKVILAEIIEIQILVNIS